MPSKNVGVIGAGISGLSISKMLLEAGMNVTLFEKNSKAGGLIKCDRINDNLFHRVGGHVFNSKNLEVLTWFWKYFDQSKEFLSAKRNAKIWLNDQFIGYPIENYLYKLPSETVANVIDELLSNELDGKKTKNFEEFLLKTFGSTLYNLYFKPYNKKLWNCDLSQVPIDWLKGKLPMPSLKSIIFNNIMKEEELEMVHSFFYYPRENGSQFIADRLAEGTNIEYDANITTLSRESGEWRVNGYQKFDTIVFCGDVRDLNTICQVKSVQTEIDALKNLRSNGSSNMFCETDITDVSWLYIPDEKFKAHRIIYTGNFSHTNNRGSERMTCVVEFSGIQDPIMMREELKMLPGNLKEIAYNIEPHSNVIQNFDTKQNVENLKKVMEPLNFFLLGRFAEWEYYNMDKAIEKAMEVKSKIAFS